MYKHYLKLTTFLMASGLIYFASCDKLDQALVQVENTNTILAKAADDLNNQSISWQETLRQTQGQLTSDAQSIIRNEINDMLIRSIAATGSEIKCLGDFIRQRLKQEVNRLIEMNRCNGDSLKVPRLAPYFCSAAPNSIDMTLAVDRRNKIDFYGFDFDRAQNIKVKVMNNAQQVLAEGSRHLSVVTHYNMVLNLSTANGLALSNQASFIVLYFGEQEISRISVRQPAVCTIKDITLNPINPQFSMTPRHDPTNKNDASFECGRMKYQCWVSLHIKSDKRTVIARVHMFGKECCSDDFFWQSCYCRKSCNSEVSEVKTFDLYVAPENTIIHEILSDKSFYSSKHELRGGVIKNISVGGNTVLKNISCTSSGSGVTSTINWAKVRLKVCQ